MKMFMEKNADKKRKICSTKSYVANLFKEDMELGVGRRIDSDFK
jgi:hypothetical protein